MEQWLEETKAVLDVARAAVPFGAWSVVQEAGSDVVKLRWRVIVAPGAVEIVYPLDVPEEASRIDDVARAMLITALKRMTARGSA